MSYYLTREDELYHYGVAGMKWGQRQYQNKDGSLTELGRQHYGYGSARGTGYRALSKVYGLNEKFYSKGNSRFAKQMTSMNKAAKNQMLKKADAADRKAAQYKQSDEYKARQAKVKKALKIGAAVAGTALAAYGAYKLSKYVSNKRVSQGKNLASTIKFQETLSKRYNDVIGNSNGTNPEIAKKYFNKNQALKADIARNQNAYNKQVSAERTRDFKSNLAKKYNNVVGNMNGVDSDKAAKYYARQKKLEREINPPIKEAIGNARNAASKGLSSARTSMNSAANKVQNTYKKAVNLATSKSDSRKLESLRDEFSNLVSRGKYYESRLATPGLPAETKLNAKHEYDKIMSDLRSLQGRLDSISRRRG